MKSTQQYQDWLFSSEREAGISFGEWLRQREYSILAREQREATIESCDED